MRVLAILLLLVGAAGIFIGLLAIGDIGLAALIGGITAVLSGIAIFLASSRLKSLEARLAGPSSQV